MDDEPDDMQLDEMIPWQIRVISRRAKNTALAKARDAGLTVSQWIERRIFEDEIPRPTVTDCNLVELLTVIAAIGAAPNINLRRFPGLAALVREKVAEARGLQRISTKSLAEEPMI